MEKNMGSTDRILRILIALIIITLYFTTNIFSHTAAIILLIVSTVFILTSIVGVCPLYLPLGIRTCARKKLP